MFARHFCGYSEGRFLPEFHYDCRRMAVIPRRLVIAILALAALGGMRAAAAADSLPIEILKAEVGYGGVHKFSVALAKAGAYAATPPCSVTTSSKTNRCYLTQRSVRAVAPYRAPPSWGRR